MSTTWPSAEPGWPSGKIVTRPSSGTSEARTGRPSSVIARSPLRHGVLLERVARARSERTDREQERDSERDERAAHAAEQQAPAGQRSFALERVLERLAFLGRGGQRMPLLDERSASA